VKTKVLASAVAVIFTALVGCYDNNRGQLRNGDIIFQSSQGGLSEAIELATKSKYNHVGIIYIENGQTFVYEAVQPVKLTPLQDWINRGKNGHFQVKRLKDADEVLTPEVLAKMKQLGEGYLGKDYDFYFQWSDERMYCSELVWKLYREAANVELTKLQTIGDFDLSHGVVQAKIEEIFGGNIPLEEPAISPVAIFNSERLETVEQ